DGGRAQALSLSAASVMEKAVSITDILAALGATGRPAPTPTEPRGEGSRAREPTVAPPAEPGRILIVDDDPEMRAMLSDFLTLKGYSAQAVPDGAAAVREIVAAPPDVVLLDINMPGLSGLEALPTIRAGAPRAVVIMISATGDAATA